MYERQHLRELEALRPDVSGANKKHIPQKPVSAPRPSYVPPLEDFSSPPVQRPASNPPPNMPRPGPTNAPPLSATSSMYGPPRVPPFNASISTNVPSHGPSGVSSPVRGPLPPQSPGAGPSSSPVPSQTSFASPLPADGPPLGGRLVDGTKSMFVKPPSSPLATSASKPASAGLPPVPTSNGAQSQAQTPISPLHASVSGPPSATPSFAPRHYAGGGDPLSASAFVPSASPLGNGRSNSVSAPSNDGLDPLGMTKPAYMSQTVRSPQRPRLDAREAASKLANMF